MTFALEEFEQYLRIDKNALDEALTQQSQLFYKVADAFTEAVAERDALKEKLSLVDAELDGEIRVWLEKDGEKFTEAMVRNQVQAHKDHEAAFNVYIKAKTRADKIQAMKDSFKMRGYAIRDLCELHVTGYFDHQSVKETNSSDRIVYEKRRERLAEARTKKGS